VETKKSLYCKNTANNLTDQILHNQHDDEKENLMFYWPCIVTYPYSNNQQDALFTFNN